MLKKKLINITNSSGVTCRDEQICDNKNATWMAFLKIVIARISKIQKQQNLEKTNKRTNKQKKQTMC